MHLLNANTELKETWRRNVIHVSIWQYAYSQSKQIQKRKRNNHRGSEFSKVFSPVNVLHSGAIST